MAGRMGIFLSTMRLLEFYKTSSWIELLVLSEKIVHFTKLTFNSYSRLEHEYRCITTHYHRWCDNCTTSNFCRNIARSTQGTHDISKGLHIGIFQPGGTMIASPLI